VEYKIITKKKFAKNLLNVLVYLEKEWSKTVADEFYDRINNIIILLKSNPYIGAPSKKLSGARGLSITKHNRLFYKIENNKIIIVSLADTRKKNYD